MFNSKFTGTKAPNPNFKKLKSGKYQFSIKYGIRSLDKVLDGATYISGIETEQMDDAFDAAIEIVKDGSCDKAIQAAIAANKSMRAAKKK